MLNLKSHLVTTIIDINKLSFNLNSVKQKQIKNNEIHKQIKNIIMIYDSDFA